MKDIHFDQNKDKWRLDLEINGHIQTLGYFDSIADALRYAPPEFSWMD
jgi:hypothetical protein